MNVGQVLFRATVLQGVKTPMGHTNVSALRDTLAVEE